MSPSSIVMLSDASPFAIGGHRLCFQHPGNPLFCIKVPRPDSTRTGRFDENQLDYRAYKKIESRTGEGIWNHVPRCHGLVETDLGRGLVMDYIKAEDGKPAQTLTQRLAGGFDPRCRAALDEFEDFLLSYRLPIGDLRPCNLVVSFLPDSGKERIYVIDGLGDQDFLWSSWFRSFHYYKIKRKIARLEKRIADHLSGKRVIVPRKY